MNTPELLLTLAQIGVTLAGLSGIAGAIQLGQAARSTNLSDRLLPAVATAAMPAALFAVVPVGLLGGEDAAVWRLCSIGALMIWAVIYGSYIPLLIRMVRRAQRFEWINPLVGFLLTVLGMGLLAYNVIAPSIASPRRYAMADICLLVIAGVNFFAYVFGLRARLGA